MQEFDVGGFRYDLVFDERTGTLLVSGASADSRRHNVAFVERTTTSLVIRGAEKLEFCWDSPPDVPAEIFARSPAARRFVSDTEGSNAAVDSIGRLMTDIEERLASVRAWRATTEQVLRADSATRRADTIFLQLRPALDARVRHITKPFYERPFQELIWPEGAAADYRRRTQGRPNARATPGEIAIADSLRRVLADGGIWSNRAEGTVYFDASHASLLNWFGRFLTRQLQAFLRFSAQQQEKPVADDASLMIRPDELAERLVRVERILADFPSSPAREPLLHTHQQYLAAYLGGLPNSSAFDWRTRVLRPDFRQSHRKFLREHGSTAAGRIIAEYTRLLARKGFVRTRESDAFLTRRWATLHDDHRDPWFDMRWCALRYHGGYRPCWQRRSKDLH